MSMKIARTLVPLLGVSCFLYLLIHLGYTHNTARSLATEKLSGSNLEKILPLNAHMCMSNICSDSYFCEHLRDNRAEKKTII